jgi:beta-glucanase (GH16 family)
VAASAAFIIGVLGITVMPADAAVWWYRATTTTTKARATTTTTKAPVTTTTTKAPATTTTAPATTTTAAPAGASGCGATLLKADGTPWVCTMADNFDGTALNRSLWVPQTTAVSGFGSGDDCYVDDPDNVAVSGGTLQLTVRKEAAPFTCTKPGGSFSTTYTSASVSTFSKFSQTFGRFEFRAKFPTAGAKGLHGALWLWPDNAVKYGGWPWSGEIDVAEVYSLYNDRAIPYVHYVPKAPDYNVTNNYCMLKPDEWHTYVAEWTPTTITVKYDGVTCIQDNWNPYGLTKPAPFDHPFMVAVTQGLGVTGNRLDPAAPPAFPSTLQVDYVRVWK